MEIFNANAGAILWLVLSTVDRLAQDQDAAVGQQPRR